MIVSHDLTSGLLETKTDHVPVTNFGYNMIVNPLLLLLIYS